MPENESDLVEPIHAESFFSVSRTGEIHERLCFEYLDYDGYYSKVIQDEYLLSKETAKLSSNMQYFLDQEKVEINEERVESVVRYVDIFLKEPTDVVSIVYLIDFAGKLQKGGNKIQTWLEEEEAPYDFEIIWRFPYGTQITEINTKLDYQIYNGDFVVLWALQGDSVGGYELMEFIIPERNLDTRIAKTREKV